MVTNTAGLAGVVAGQSAIATVGHGGRGLNYRGYSIDDLARQASFEEVAYLLHYGKGKSFLEMARIHNGGPRGCAKKATLCYARKILADGSLPSGFHAQPSSHPLIH